MDRTSLLRCNIVVVQIIIGVAVQCFQDSSNLGTSKCLPSLLLLGYFSCLYKFMKLLSDLLFLCFQGLVNPGKVRQSNRCEYCTLMASTQSKFRWFPISSLFTKHSHSFSLEQRRPFRWISAQVLTYLLTKYLNYVMMFWRGVMGH